MNWNFLNHKYLSVWEAARTVEMCPAQLHLLFDGGYLPEVRYRVTKRGKLQLHRDDLLTWFADQAAAVTDDVI